MMAHRGAFQACSDQAMKTDFFLARVSDGSSPNSAL
jgi:hypothetical protein